MAIFYHFFGSSKKKREPLKSSIIKLVSTGVLALGLAGCGSAASSSNAPSSNNATTTTLSMSASAKKLFPDGLTILVGFGTGGAVDTGARLIAPVLSKELGVNVVVQNMVGGGGNTAAQYEYNQPSTSSDLLMSFLPALALGQVLGNGKYELDKLTPVYGIYGNNTAVIIAKKGSKYKDFASLKNATSTITAATAGVKTSATWMALAFLSGVNHINVKPVPFKGGSAGSDAALGGSVDLSATTIVEATRLIQSGKAQGVLEFAPHTYPQLPGVESIATVGQADEAFTSPMGLTGPPQMPSAKVDLIAKALAAAVQDPSLTSKATNVGLEVSPLSTSDWSQTLNQTLTTIKKDQSFLETYK